MYVGWGGEGAGAPAEAGNASVGLSGHVGNDFSSIAGFYYSSLRVWSVQRLLPNVFSLKKGADRPSLVALRSLSISLESLPAEDLSYIQKELTTTILEIYRSDIISEMIIRIDNFNIIVNLFTPAYCYHRNYTSNRPPARYSAIS